MQLYLKKNFKYILYRFLISYRSLGKKKIYNYIKENTLIFIKDNCDLITGYYDINPFSLDDKYLLFHKINKFNNKNIDVDLFIYDLQNNKKKIISKTNLFCTQFGSRLNWFDNKNYIISSNILDNKIQSTFIWDFKNDKIRLINKINHSIYSWSPNKKYGVIFNMKRLAKLRGGYGYKSIDYNSNIKFPINDGIKIIEYENNIIKHFLTFSDLCPEKFREKKYQNYFHYISHCVWNDDSNIIMFDYVITDSNKRYSQLCFFNLIDNSFWYWDSENTTKVSHFTWLDNKNFFVTAIKKNFNLKFYVGKYNNNVSEEIEAINGDGHPSLYKNKNILLDTYPDRYGMQNLYKFNLKDKRIENISKFYSPAKYIGANKCDLHPKLSISNQYIGIDSCFNKKREIIVIKNNNEK